MYNYQVPTLWYVTMFQNGQSFFKKFFDEQSAYAAAQEFASIGVDAEVTTFIKHKALYQEIW